MRGGAGKKAVWSTAAVALALGASALPAAAEDESGDGEQVTVTATRSALNVDAAPSVVTVIDADEIEENLATDIKDLVRFEPGVSVPTSPSRFGAALGATGRDGNSGFTIRGMGGNRVLFQVDGIRVPDGFSFGPNAFGRGDYVDLDLLQAVEIVRGPASVLYGSDGLAGVVSFITRDPADFLRDDETFAARVRLSYASADDSFAQNLTGALRLSDQVSALVAYTHRDARETENQGAIDTPDSRRTVPNPQDISSDSLLARVVFEPSEQHRFRLTGDYSDREIVTEALSGRAILPPAGPPLSAGSVIDLDGVDESERSRVTLDYTLTNDGGPIDRAFIAVYAQDSWLRQFSDEDRNTSADRTRDTTYDNDVWGLTAQGESQFEGGAVNHRLVYGIDYSVTTQGAIRDGTVPTPPAVFPDRPFPETEYTRTGVFLVDEISLANGAITLFPGLRYDEYELSPRDDALYSGLLSGQSGDHISPKFGIVAWPTDSFGVFFNYAEGFKAPAPSEVNNYFENLSLGAFG
jgi:hemoglobin/transferrin/lactoferrin receptor protein